MATSERAQLLSAMTHPSTVLDLVFTPKSYIYIYIYGREKKKKNIYIYIYIYGREKNKSPDEWATTKQACRDELVVYLFFSLPYIFCSTSMY